MDFTGALKLPPNKPFRDLVSLIEKVLGVAFMPETSWRYEEFPAYVADVLGMEIAILGIPSEEYLDEIKPVEDYSILIQTYADTEDDDIETDLSIHVKSLLQANGIECSVDNA